MRAIGHQIQQRNMKTAGLLVHHHNIAAILCHAGAGIISALKGQPLGRAVAQVVAVDLRLATAVRREQQRVSIRHPGGLGVYRVMAGDPL